MKLSYSILGLLVCFVAFSACEPVKEPVYGGEVLVGDMAGEQFTIATGNETEIMKELVHSFNAMDAAALWEHSADTISFHQANGTSGPLTQADMAGLFSTIDSLQWNVGVILPVQVRGSEQVNVLVPGEETVYYKDGTVERRRLMERFVFVDEKITEVYQWTAAMSGDEGSGE